MKNTAIFKNFIMLICFTCFIQNISIAQCPASCTDPATVYIASVDNDGPGADGCEEFVEICYYSPCDCTESIDISGWTLEDNVTTTGGSGEADITLLIASGSLMPGECVQLVSSNLDLGVGMNGTVNGDMGSAIEYGSTRQACPVWNNGGDGIFLFDGDEQAGGSAIDSETDPDGTDGITMFTAPTDPCPAECDTAPVMGCTDPCSPNYDPMATVDDGSCEAYDMTCNTDCSLGPFGGTWDPATCACINEITPVVGCTDPAADNYDPAANCNDGCITVTCGATASTISTTDPTRICVDGIGDPINVSVDNDGGGSSAWVITDAAGIILALPPGPPFDLDGAGAGQCLIWYVNSDDAAFNPMVGDDAAAAVAASSCAFLSNPITVDRIEVAGATISTTDNLTICTDDGVDEPINVAIDDAGIGAMGAWVITDGAGTILDLPTAPPFVLDGAGVGTCLIWWVNYDDPAFAPSVGEDAAAIVAGASCAALSNPITVNRIECNPPPPNDDCDADVGTFGKSGNN